MEIDLVNKVCDEKKRVGPPKVSVCCLVFNHGIYLEQALKSVLTQKTDFDFEIIVHDDASTDNSKEIIENILCDNPGKIKAIYQKKNEYGSWPNKPFLNVVKAAQGEYIAILECDDYWVDEYKLQKQIDAIDLNDCAEMVVTNGFNEYKKGEIKKRKRYERKFIGARDLKKIGSGGVITSSWIIKKNKIERLIDYLDPSVAIGDYFIQWHCVLNGPIIALSERCVVYRVESLGSWSSRKNEKKLFLERLLENINSFYVYEKKIGCAKAHFILYELYKYSYVLAMNEIENPFRAAITFLKSAMKYSIRANYKDVLFAVLEIMRK